MTASYHPFHGWLAIEDSLRLVVVALGLYLLVVLVRVGWSNPAGRTLPPQAAWGAATFALLIVSAVGTEALKIGHPFSDNGFFWRLPVNLAAMVTGAMYARRIVQNYPKPNRTPSSENPWHP